MGRSQGPSGRLLGAAAASVLLHAQLVALGVLLYEPEEELLEVASVDASEVDATGAPAVEVPTAAEDEEIPKPEPRPRVPAEAPRDKPARTEVARWDEPPPLEATLEPERPKALPPRPLRPERQKSVEQLYDKDEADNPDARFLGDKNRRVRPEDEMQARSTNLVKQARGEGEASSTSARTDSDAGEDRRRKLVAGQLDRRGPRKAERARRGQEGADARAEETPRKRTNPLLAMRDAARAGTEKPEREHPLGTLPSELAGVKGGQGQRRRGAAGKVGPDLALSPAQVRRALGDAAGEAGGTAARSQLAEERRSFSPGKHVKKWGRIQAALENFVPEVRPGTQTALGTRASPFAAYIARMHRQIHQLWGFGIIEDWNASNGGAPMDAWTMLEIVLDAEGTVEKVTVARASGTLFFDVAAIDVVMSAGPYPDPPAAIRSKNGKIYLHWRFHRDNRECMTAGVDPYILGETPPDGEVHDEAVHAAPRPGAGAEEHIPRIPSFAQRQRRLRKERPEEPDRASQAAAEHASRVARIASPDDPGANAVARKWLEAFKHGDARAMAGASAVPLRSGDVVIREPKELEARYRDLVGEEERRGQARIEVMSPATLRGRRGALPAQAQQGSGALHALVEGAGDAIVLTLGERDGDWRVIGVDR